MPVISNDLYLFHLVWKSFCKQKANVKGQDLRVSNESGKTQKKSKEEMTSGFLERNRSANNVYLVTNLQKEQQEDMDLLKCQKCDVNWQTISFS